MLKVLKEEFIVMIQKQSLKYFITILHLKKLIMNVNYAEKYLGCPYIYGGTSFKTGIDCSAYVQKIFANFGYKLPRNSAAQSNVGKSISASQLRPGDLVFYRRGGKIGHVAIYIGNNRIIHASNKRDGVKYSNMYYTTPAKYVRVVK